MLITEFTEISVTTFNAKHLQEKGYSFSKYGEKIKIKVTDLPSKSHIKVKIKCDYCGEEFEREYRGYLKGHVNNKDCCKKCTHLKIVETMKKRYGGVGLASKVLKEKIRQTNIEKYGCEIPFQNKEIIEKIKQTNQEKYGGLGMASPIIREKIEKFNMENYGVKNPSQRPEVKKKKEGTCLEHFGVEHILQIPEVSDSVTKKAQETLHKRGKVPCSKMEESLINMLTDIYGVENCFPSYLVAPLTFDCLLVVNDEKIDVEYDGWYWHKDTEERDRKRNYKVLDLGYKILRIKSKFLLPTEEQIKSAIEYLTNENHHYAEIILDI